MKTQVVVLGASRYSFPNRETGEIIEGTKVHFIELNQPSTDHKVGLEPAQATLPYEYFDQMKAIPGIYDAELTVNLASKNKQLKVVGFEFKREYSFAK